MKFSLANTTGMADTDISNALAQSAASPKTVNVQGMGTSEDHPLGDQIKAAKFLPSIGTARRVGGGIKFTKATAGGAVR